MSLLCLPAMRPRASSQRMVARPRLRRSRLMRSWIRCPSPARTIRGGSAFAGAAGAAAGGRGGGASGAGELHDRAMQMAALATSVPMDRAVLLMGQAEMMPLSVPSEPLEQVVILLERAKRFHGGEVQEPAERKDRDGETDLPCRRRTGTPPEQGQRQRPDGKDGDDDGDLPEIPRKLFFRGAPPGCGIQELAAVPALDRGILDLFGAVRTL